MCQTQENIMRSDRVKSRKSLVVSHESKNPKKQMYRVIPIILLVFLLFACKNGSSSNHLPHNVMQKILLDINLAEAYSVNIKDSVRRSSMKNTDSLAGFYITIFKHYNITAEEFAASLEWYKAHPEELDSMYNKMLPVATRMQVKIPEPPKPVMKADTTIANKIDSSRKIDTIIKSKVDTVKKRKPHVKKKIKADPATIKNNPQQEKLP